jgi:hypothetical protein
MSSENLSKDVFIFSFFGVSILACLDPDPDSQVPFRIPQYEIFPHIRGLRLEPQH